MAVWFLVQFRNIAHFPCFLICHCFLYVADRTHEDEEKRGAAAAKEEKNGMKSRFKSPINDSSAEVRRNRVWAHKEAVCVCLFYCVQLMANVKLLCRAVAARSYSFWTVSVNESSCSVKRNARLNLTLRLIGTWATLSLQAVTLSFSHLPLKWTLLFCYSITASTRWPHTCTSMHKTCNRCSIISLLEFLVALWKTFKYKHFI